MYALLTMFTLVQPRIISRTRLSISLTIPPSTRPSSPPSHPFVNLFSFLLLLFMFLTFACAKSIWIKNHTLYAKGSDWKVHCASSGFYLFILFYFFQQYLHSCFWIPIPSGFALLFLFSFVIRINFYLCSSIFKLIE